MSMKDYIEARFETIQKLQGSQALKYHFKALPEPLHVGHAVLSVRLCPKNSLLFHIRDYTVILI